MDISDIMDESRDMEEATAVLGSEMDPANIGGSGGGTKLQPPRKVRGGLGAQVRGPSRPVGSPSRHTPPLLVPLEIPTGNALRSRGWSALPTQIMVEA